MSASELKPGDRITISGKAYCVRVEDGEVALRPFNPTPHPEAVRVAVQVEENMSHGSLDVRAVTEKDINDFAPQRRFWIERHNSRIVVPRTEITIDPATGRVVADELEWVNDIAIGLEECVTTLKAHPYAADPGMVHLIAEMRRKLPAPRAADAEAKPEEPDSEPCTCPAPQTSDGVFCLSCGSAFAEPDAYPNAVGPVKEQKQYPPFDIEQCKRDNGAALKVGGFETNKGHAPIPVRVLSFGGYGAHGRSRHRLPVEFENGTWGRVKISNLANIERATQEDADER